MFIVIQKINIKVTKKKDLFLFFGYNVKNFAKIVIFEYIGSGIQFNNEQQYKKLKYCCWLENNTYSNP